MLFLLGCRTEDYTKGEPAICEVHHIQMTRTTVPIEYGLPDLARFRLRYDACTNSFPHGDCFVLGGCCVSFDSPRRAITFVCPECKKAADAWNLSYEKTH
jgi:hypothetical protein